MKKNFFEPGIGWDGMDAKKYAVLFFLLFFGIITIATFTIGFFEPFSFAFTPFAGGLIAILGYSMKGWW